MGAQERWAAAASEVLGTPVSVAIPLSRRREGGRALFVLGAVAFTLVVVAFTVIAPGVRLIGYFLGALLMSLCVQLGQELVFAARTAHGIQVVSSTRWSPQPVGPALGPLDPATVSGPGGLFRNVFDIGGVKHRTSATQTRRFRDLVGQSSR